MITNFVICNKQVSIAKELVQNSTQIETCRTTEYTPGGGEMIHGNIEDLLMVIYLNILLCIH